VLRGELIVFSDASSELEPKALRRLVRAFADSRVGCVSGCYRLRSEEAKPRDQGEGLYWRYETSLKAHEGLLHSILGAHGAFYAIRKRLFRPLEPGAINDDYLIPMRIVEQGSRAIYEPSAVAWEREPTPSVAREFARRRRIAAGNWQQIAALRHLLHPARGWVALCFFSHKVLRPAAPLLLVMLLLSSGWLARPWAAVAFLAQGIFYTLALLGYLCGRHRVMARWLSVPLYFCLGHLAALSGFVSYCLRRRLPAWR
jgi:cellulose synthase/poly-beta-1,6-N-acetylglucosamine synthase-like glycosyltransferase